MARAGPGRTRRGYLLGGHSAGLLLLGVAVVAAIMGGSLAGGGLGDLRGRLWPSATPTLTATPTATRTPSPTATQTTTATPTPTDTPTSTATASPTPTRTRTALPAPATATPTQLAMAPAPARMGPVERLVLANYFTWYSADSWDGCNISAGDRPAEPYSSDDPNAIARQVRQALDAGIDGFTLQWFAPGERTDRNLQTLLERSQGTPFRSTVVFLRHIWPGSPAASQAEVVKAIRYLIDQYGRSPNWLTIEGRPVIFFTDMYRIPLASGQTPQQAWAQIRAQADPQHGAWWIAEGLDPSYLEVFDGLYVYKVVHADYPEAYLKAVQWAASVRQWEQRTGQPKLWWATVTPGWDDLRSGCTSDIRTPSKRFRRDRADGGFYRATFDAALASRPDGLWINSWNEWVEGTCIEPSVQYGDRYLELTLELADRFRGQP